MTCGWCHEPMQSEEKHLMFHWECHIRQVVGSVAHQMGRCSCYGGFEDDPPDISVREAALLAVQLWMKKHGGSLLGVGPIGQA